MTTGAFATILKDQQIKWALQQGIGGALENEQGKPRWLFRNTERSKNFFDPKWLSLIHGHEHRWVRALNSSQAFAVNLFAPSAEDPALAKSILTGMLPHRRFAADHEVHVQFEFQAPKARWLGEEKTTQPTQVDVTFVASDKGSPIGYLLVEVKLSEELGNCRGYKHQAKQRGDRSPCLSLNTILQDPTKECWIVQQEGRKYWELMQAQQSGFNFNSATPHGACPFRHGGYQLMRTRVLANVLVSRGKAQWADVAICAHPDGKINDSTLSDFDSFVENRPIRIEPREIVREICEHCPVWRRWADYMLERYRL